MDLSESLKSNEKNVSYYFTHISFAKGSDLWFIIPESIIVFSRIVLGKKQLVEFPRGTSRDYKYGSERHWKTHIKKKFPFPYNKSNLLEQILETLETIKYSRRYTSIFPGIVFHKGRDNRKIFQGNQQRLDFWERKVLKNTYQRIDHFSNNKSTFREKLLLDAENNITKYWKFCITNPGRLCFIVDIFALYIFAFMTSEIPFILLVNFSSNWQRAIWWQAVLTRRNW